MIRELFDWLFNSEERIDLRTFDIDNYQKRMKPINAIRYNTNAYIPQIFINGKWKTLCYTYKYRVRMCKTLYYFLMPDNIEWCSKEVNGRFEKEPNDKLGCEILFINMKKRHLKALEDIQKDEIRKHRPIIDLN